MQNPTTSPFAFKADFSSGSAGREKHSAAAKALPGSALSAPRLLLSVLQQKTRQKPGPRPVLWGALGASTTACGRGDAQAPCPAPAEPTQGCRHRDVPHQLPTSSWQPWHRAAQKGKAARGSSRAFLRPRSQAEIRGCLILPGFRGGTREQRRIQLSLARCGHGPATARPAATAQETSPEEQLAPQTARPRGLLFQGS